VFYLPQRHRGPQRFTEKQERYVSPFEIATVYADLDETDLALEWFEKALAERANWMVFLNTTPKFDRLRAAPGYSALLKRIGFD
jgi:hypothetical protein